MPVIMLLSIIWRFTKLLLFSEKRLIGKQQHTYCIDVLVLWVCLSHFVLPYFYLSLLVPTGSNSKWGEFKFGLAFRWQRRIFSVLVYCKTSTSSQMWSNEQPWKAWMEINRSNDVVKLVRHTYFLPAFIKIKLLMFYCFSFNLQKLNVDGRATGFLLVPK